MLTTADRQLSPAVARLVPRLCALAVLAMVFSSFGLGSGPTAPGAAEAQIVKRFFERTGRALKRTGRRIRSAFKSPRRSRVRIAKSRKPARKTIKASPSVLANHPAMPTDPGERPIADAQVGGPANPPAKSFAEIHIAREDISRTPPLPVKQPRPWHDKQGDKMQAPALASGPAGVTTTAQAPLIARKSEDTTLDLFKVLATFGESSAIAAEHRER